MFKKATKTQSRARVALIGPSGSGKTYTALRLAMSLAQGRPVAVVDTERGSASKYAGDPSPDGGSFQFDVVDDWPDFQVGRYIDAIRGAEAAGYAVLVIDSLSHAWAGPGGLLEFVDARSSAQKGSNSFAAWRDATPLHNKLVDAMLRANLHIIVTMRSKQEYVLERDERTGKMTPRKVGLAPVQREGLEYEFDVVLDVDGASVTASKSRCSTIAGRRFVEPGADLGAELLAWLGAGEAPPPPFDSRAHIVASLPTGLPIEAVEGFLGEKGKSIVGLSKADADKAVAYISRPETLKAIETYYFGGSDNAS